MTARLNYAKTQSERKADPRRLELSTPGDSVIRGKRAEAFWTLLQRIRMEHETVVDTCKCTGIRHETYYTLKRSKCIRAREARRILDAYNKLGKQA